jgi:non-specific serine/threonine protein kinase
MGDKWGITMSLSNLGTAALAQGDYAAARASYQESLRLCKEMDEKTLVGYALLGLGLVDLSEHKPGAREYILQSLQVRLEKGEQLPQVSSLIGVAGLVLQDGDAQFATQLLGAIQSAVQALHAIVEVDVKFFHEQTLAAVKDQLGEVAFQSAWEDGKKLSLDEAVTLVLEGMS